jgi:hypothetical protein
MTHNVAFALGRPPSACTLPTAEQPLVVAEFVALFVEAVQPVTRPEHARLRLELGCRGHASGVVIGGRARE